MRFASFKDCFSANPRIHDQTSEIARVNRRKWILAVDTHYEPFYRNTTGLWIHAYKPEKRNAKKATNS